MANEIQFTDKPGRADLDYVNITASDGQWWNVSDLVFELFNEANLEDYVLGAMEVGATGVYYADMPLAIPPGIYNVVARYGEGGVMLANNPIVAVGSIDWGGSGGIVSPSRVQDLAEADEVIVTGPAGWTLEYRRKGTGEVLLVKQLKKLDGSPLTGEGVTVGRKVQ